MQSAGKKIVSSSQFVSNLSEGDAWDLNRGASVLTKGLGSGGSYTREMSRDLYNFSAELCLESSVRHAVHPGRTKPYGMSMQLGDNGTLFPSWDCKPFIH